MPVAELDISPRTRGRAKRSADAVLVRPLAEADLALLASERATPPRPIQALRDRHHSLARALAHGASDSEASAITGYDPSRISVLKRDPTFRELLEHYRSAEDSAAADFAARAGVLALTAMNAIQEAFEDPENPPSLSMALEVAKTFADRTGNGPVSKTSNVNVNVDLGSRLAAARARAPVLDADFVAIEGPKDE